MGLWFYNFGAIGILYFVGFVVAGFIARFLAKEKKVRYGFYEGICVTIFIHFISGSIGSLSTFILGSVVGILLASIGAILAIKIDKDSKNIVKN